LAATQFTFDFPHAEIQRFRANTALLNSTCYPLLTMSWCGQVLSRRLRLLLLIGGVSFLLLTLHSIGKRYSNHPHGYLPDFLSDHLDPNLDYYGQPFGGEPILQNDTEAVHCSWAEVDQKSTRKIRAKPAPAFPLLSAWLKPEAGAWAVCQLGGPVSYFGGQRGTGPH
jgi:hypothetical protein